MNYWRAALPDSIASLRAPAPRIGRYPPCLAHGRRGFAVDFTVFGVIYSFGVFLEPIMADLGSSRSATSAFYAISSSVFYFLGPATGSVGDRLGPRVITGFGALGMAGGLAATAFVTDIGTAYLTYGLGVGIGAACAYIPTFTVVGGWFEKWRTRALSIATTGAATLRELVSRSRWARSLMRSCFQ